MNISGPFVKRPIGTSLMAAGVLAIGILCYFLLGISALPEVSFPAIWVSAAEPGGSGRLQPWLRWRNSHAVRRPKGPSPTAGAEIAR